MAYLQSMKIFSAEQIRNWDAYTILHEPVSSVDLMERAAKKCFEIISWRFKNEKFSVICGPGNNGGDGLVIARLLLENGADVNVYLSSDKKGSSEYQTNLKRIKKLTNPQIITEISELSFTKGIVVDAMFGTGLNKAPDKFYKNIFEKINNSGVKIVSIDIPSGMFTDRSSRENNVVKSDLTLTFQRKKPAFFMPENAPFLKEIQVIDIGLSKEFEESESAFYNTTDEIIIGKIYRKRNPFANKGNYGYACLIAGSYGMMGAAVLAAKSCLRSGAGKVSCHTCEKGYDIIQNSVPEAMCSVSGKDHIAEAPDISHFDSIGIGPGIGRFSSNKELLKQVFSGFKKPLVIDADALNTISENKELLKIIPRQSILTPHPREFERLFGKTKNDFEQRALAVQKSTELKIFIVLKGHYTFITTPEGNVFINETGNPGMATGGSGDVLTGILTGLLAQKYSPEESCMLGVYLHGKAGDLAAHAISQEALVAGDITRYLGKAFLQLSSETKQQKIS